MACPTGRKKPIGYGLKNNVQRATDKLTLNLNWTAILPEIFITLTALGVLGMDLFYTRYQKDKTLNAIVALSGMGIAFLLLPFLSAKTQIFTSLFVSDPLAIFFKMVFLIAASMTVLISMNYLKMEGFDLGEYYAVLLFSILGMMVMASANDFILIYLGLELMTVSFYVLSGFFKTDLRSNEAALKYLILGGFASALFLYGISLLYGVTGSTEISYIAGYLTEQTRTGVDSRAGVALVVLSHPLLSLSLIMLLAGLCFKVAAVPFHMWTPDVYEGAPTSVTAFMSVGPKAAGFVVMLRVLLVALGALEKQWMVILTVISILTMTLGNIVAIAQQNVKRMLAYSSIAHAGYILLGIVASARVPAAGSASVVFYILSYAFMNLGAFTVLLAVRKEDKQTGLMVPAIDLEDFSGLSKRDPLTAFLMLIFMFSLTGIPPTAGFVGKFYLFMSAVDANLVWLAVIGVINSAISAYYYLRILVYIYMKEPKVVQSVDNSSPLWVALYVMALATLLIGILPNLLFNAARASVVSLF
ncbi:MAG TPA: NADH-quinone oxidoreductase subunit N [Candidatus Limnocylindrales bacterium]|nr:NADH-quinone oxidoreductase subunit N [Candidatus Limnocylindrales bacterium]